LQTQRLAPGRFAPNSQERRRCQLKPEAILLCSDLAFLVHEIDIHAVCGDDDLKRAPFPGSRQTQHAGKDTRRSLAIARPYDGVVELDAHGRPLTFP
jgi:hypothetical protein